MSTRVDLRWLAQQAAEAAHRDIPLPSIAVQSNPPVGLVNLPTYFWVDPATYQGQPYSLNVVLPSPWTVDWDYMVTETVTVPCPPESAPGSHCTSTQQVQRHHHEDHMDVANIALTLTPAHYRWTFGDDAAAYFADNSGIGTPYEPSSRCCASLVQHNYSQSSFRLFDQGGFPIHLTATWTARAVINVTRDGVPALNQTVTLANRTGDYDFRYQVRESQPVIVR